jgi:DNA-binding CsgD family transcriptional regulator
VVHGLAEADAHTALILVDLDGSPLPSPAALQTMFGLTAAEAQLALAIARGETPAGVARTRGVALATVRSQLASVLGKTQTRRQAELVALLARVSILP